MYVFTLMNGTVVARTSNYSVAPNGMTIDHDKNISYAFKVKVFEVAKEDFPSDFAPYKYLYTEENGFTIDSNYQEPEEQVNLEDKLLTAEAKIAELEDALCELSTIVEEVLG